MSPLKHHQKAESVDAQNYYLELELTGKNDLQPGEEIDESDPQSAEIMHIDVSENDYSGPMEPKKKNDLDECQAAATKDMEQSPDDRLEFCVPLAVILPDILFSQYVYVVYSCFARFQ